jgi:hypothetical protein
VSQTRRRRIQDFLVCLSLANLCFLNAWEEIQHASFAYYRKSAPPAILLPTIADICLLAVAFWAARWVAARLGPGALRFAQCAFLLVLACPLVSYASLVRSARRGLVAAVASIGLGLVVATLLLGVALILVYRNTAILRAARLGVLMVAPLFPLVVLQVARAGWSGSTFADKHSAPFFPDPKSPAPRVVLFIFDEMDQRLAFPARPAGIHLPELDALRSRALYATRAYPPEGETLAAVPALLTGRRISQAVIGGPGELLVTVRDTGETVPLSALPTMFSEARSAQRNTALVGWFHPYCRIFGAQLSDCSWYPCSYTPGVVLKEESPGRFDFVATMRAQLERELRIVPLWGERRLARIVRREHTRAYQEILRQALRLSSDARIGLLVIHWPIPHPLGIYDRRTGELTLDSRNNYLDNLELVDRALGETRRAMEATGCWENSTILVTSDHPLRPSAWNQEFSWSREEAAVTGNKEYPWVPFLVKVAGQRRPVTYAAPFNTVLIHDLIGGLIRGQLSTPEDVLGWLDQNRSRAPLQLALVDRGPAAR